MTMGSGAAITNIQETMGSGEINEMAIGMEFYCPELMELWLLLVGCYQE